MGLESFLCIFSLIDTKKTKILEQNRKKIIFQFLNKVNFWNSKMLTTTKNVSIKENYFFLILNDLPFRIIIVFFIRICV